MSGGLGVVGVGRAGTGYKQAKQQVRGLKG